MPNPFLSALIGGLSGGYGAWQAGRDRQRQSEQQTFNNLLNLEQENRAREQMDLYRQSNEMLRQQQKEASDAMIAQRERQAASESLAGYGTDQQIPFADAQRYRDAGLGSYTTEKSVAGPELGGVNIGGMALPSLEGGLSAPGTFRKPTPQERAQAQADAAAAAQKENWAGLFAGGQLDEQSILDAVRQGGPQSASLLHLIPGLKNEPQPRDYGLTQVPVLGPDGQPTGRRYVPIVPGEEYPLEPEEAGSPVLDTFNRYMNQFASTAQSQADSPEAGAANARRAALSMVMQSPFDPAAVMEALPETKSLYPPPVVAEYLIQGEGGPEAFEMKWRRGTLDDGTDLTLALQTMPDTVAQELIRRYGAPGRDIFLGAE